MKKLVTPSFFLALMLCGSGIALADQPGSDWLSKAQVTRKLEAQGFKHVNALEAVRGHWEGEAFQHGQIVTFHADAQTGLVTFEKAKDNARGNN